MWLFETQIKVNPKNFAGQFSTNQYSTLMVEFRLVGKVTFDLQVSNNYLKDEGNRKGISRFDFIFEGEIVKNSIDSVKITFRYPDGLNNVVSNSVDFMCSDYGWHSIHGKREATLTSVSYEMPMSTFTAVHNKFILGVYADLLPSELRFGEKIEICGPRFIETQTTEGKLELSIPQKPLQNPGFSNQFETNPVIQFYN
ncbi:predicted protein [Naegleria gruberi]|uniref:Predicted protein n=1 Tax=Naegleria gruberi TaxID=5762 RepID=D2VRX9_NAEGR|nr:uncharacterized protein NAEGRDRAFT_71743 [Naegleria gruberi]EFC40541.1 predicted protein [Naegleria gruberi]|eukprot:XP_002673285.1 predicted protein [Naegleria gruberi strain NEG-M]